MLLLFIVVVVAVVVGFYNANNKFGKIKKKVFSISLK